MELKIVLDDDEAMLAQYYADALGISMEDACKGAFMYSIRRMYESKYTQTGSSWDGDPEEATDDTALRQS